MTDKNLSTAILCCLRRDVRCAVTTGGGRSITSTSSNILTLPPLSPTVNLGFLFIEKVDVKHVGRSINLYIILGANGFTDGFTFAQETFAPITPLILARVETLAYSGDR